MVARVLWVAPYSAFPLAAGYFSANLERLLGSKVDFRLEHCTRTTSEVDPSFVRDLTCLEPRVLGLSCFFWNMDQNLMLARLARQLVPRITIVAGGPSVGTLADARRLLERHEYLDAAIAGEADFAFPELAAAVLEDREPPELEGLVLRNGREIVAASREALVDDLAKLPAAYDPDNELVQQHVASSSLVTLETLRGCRRSCHFCLYSGPVRFFPEERVQREIRFLCERGVRHVRVADSHFGGSRKRALSLFAAMAEANRQTVFTIYPDPAHVDAEYLDAARAAGCRLLSFGVQTLDPDINARLGRRPEQPRLERALAACRSHAHVPQVDLMFGLPGQDASDLIRDLTWLRSQDANDVLCTPLMLFPGTRLAAEAGSSFEVMDLPQRFARPIARSLAEYSELFAIAACARVLSRLSRAARLVDQAEPGVAALLAESRRAIELVLALSDAFEASAETQRRRARRTAERAVALLRESPAGRAADPDLLHELSRLDAIECAMRARHRELARDPEASQHRTLLLTGAALHRLELVLSDDVWLETCAAPPRYAAPARAGTMDDFGPTRCVFDCRAARWFVPNARDYELLSSFTRPRAPFQRRDTLDEALLQSVARWCEQGLLRPARELQTQKRLEETR